MQKILLASVFLTALQITAPWVVRAQVKEGKIIYERKINVHRRITDENMKNMIPEFNVSKAELSFSSDESIYGNVKEQQDIRELAGQDNNTHIVMNFGGGDIQTYRNYATERSVQQQDLGPKKYLIDDSLQKQVWKLDAGTKTVKGYACKKAITHNKQGNEVIAWYTEDIQSPSGPEVYGGLPGLILELNVNDAEIVFTALEVITKDFDKTIVKAPSNGKKISRAEFQKMMMQNQPGGNWSGAGGRTIQIIRN